MPKAKRYQPPPRPKTEPQKPEWDKELQPIAEFLRQKFQGREGVQYEVGIHMPCMHSDALE